MSDCGILGFSRHDHGLNDLHYEMSQLIEFGAS